MFRARRDDERGATAVIVTLTLIALLGMIILTVDVGQLLYKRRAMVNASDAAALAAAQSCAGLKDSDVPSAMANTYATENVSVATGGITDVVGCDGPPFGHVTVQYQMNQGLFFAGVLGFDGPAAVRTEATAGWGPAGGANPLPIVVYTGSDQGNCDIQEGIGPGVDCYLWYDNDEFGGSSFGFLNLCTEADAGKGLCNSNKVGWDIGGSTQCPDAKQYADTWINGDWTGGPNEVHYPGLTYVCRLSGFSSNLWQKNLEDRIGDDLVFPVNDCTNQVDKDGNPIGCDADAPPDKYNIIGFIVLHLDDVLDKQEWGGNSGTCDSAEMNMTPTSPDIDLDLLAPSIPGCTPYDAISNVTLTAKGPGGRCCTLGTHYTFDPATNVVDWIGNVRNRVTISWDYSEGGPCGVPPNSASAMCIKVHTVEVQFGGSAPGNGANFNLRSVRLCDLAFGSCPEDNN